MQEPDPELATSRLNTDRQLTLARISELDRDFTAIITSASEGAAGGDDEHDPEGATVAFERQHLAALIEQARAHLAAIDAALRKVESGRYGICDICGSPIGAERLAARPAALICIRCARTRR
jgi:RNA polymerase-binding transcription factor DksA